MEVLLSLGSNFADRKKHINEAMLWLTSLLSECRCSEIYETPEIHGIGDPYLNAVVEGKCDFKPEELNRLIKEYEKASGRDDECRKRGFVPIDIDIVAADGEILRERDFNSIYFTIGYHQLYRLEKSN